MAPPRAGDIRLRFDLGAPLAPIVLPGGYAIRPFSSDLAPQAHALLAAVFPDDEPDFGVWRDRRLADPEYDSALVFPAFAGDGQMAGLCWCWTSNYVKDLAVAPAARGGGLGRALLLTAFSALKSRGALHADLKTNRFDNAAACRLYRGLGMTEVDWEG